MTTYNHTAIPASPKQPANAATINSPMAQLDAAVGDLTTLGTTPKTSVVGALGTAAPTTTAQTIVGAINELDAAVGDLTTLNSDVRTSLVGAINSLLDGAAFTGAVTVSGTLQATTLLGNGAGITGLTGATGGVSNTGSTTIGADTDADNVGEIALQTKNVTRLLIDNDGNLKGSQSNICLGIGTNSIAATGNSACVIAGGGDSGGAGFTNTIESDCYLGTISGGYDHHIGDGVLSGAIANTIGGGGHNNISTGIPDPAGVRSGHGAIAAALANHGTIGGGSYNYINGGNYGVIGGGTANWVQGLYGTVAGGVKNTASGESTTVGGGNTNTASGSRSTVGGGMSNVASSSYGVIAGGLSNVADGAAAAVVAGGSTNHAHGTYSAVGGGYTNDNAGDYAAIPGGRDNTITSAGDYALVAGQGNSASGTHALVAGYGNSAAGNYSTAIGHEGTARLHGALTQADGKISAVGDAQTSVVVLAKQTSDATPAQLLLHGSSNGITVPVDTTYGFDALIVARRADVDGESAFYRLTGCINNNAGTTALVGSVTQTVIAEDTAGWDVAASASNGADALVLNVTGAAGATINWVARVTLVEVTG